MKGGGREARQLRAMVVGKTRSETNKRALLTIPQTGMNNVQVITLKEKARNAVSAAGTNIRPAQRKR
jgi:hypothetical protein